MPQIGFFSGAPGPGELLLVFLVVLLLFGPRKLPEFARMLGNLMQQFRRASNDFRDQLMNVEGDASEADHNAIEELPDSDAHQDECDPYESDPEDASENVADVDNVIDDEDKDREAGKERSLAG